MKYKLRPRQEEAVNRIFEFVSNSKKNHGVFVYPTSFGKSLVISELASKFPNKYFLNVTTSKELLKQNYDKYTSFGFEADICSTSLNSNSVGKVTFATMGSVIKHTDFFKDKDVVVIDDECQNGSNTGSQLQKFIKKLNKYKLVGVTATPFRLSSGMEGTVLKMMNRDRKCLYKSIEDVVQISEVVEQGYWSKLDYEIKEVDEKSLKYNSTGADYTDESIQKFKEDNNILLRIKTEVKKLIAEGRKSILISVPFIQDALELETEIEECRAVYSGMDNKERDNIINGFKNLNIKVISQCMILSVGFDHPQLDAIIMAKPSNSLTFYYQYLGRGVRIHDTKKDCKVVDLSGNFRKFGKIEEISIINHELTKGWAVFGGDMLLSNFPLNTTNRPTLDSLKRKQKWEEKKKETDEKITFYFGKYKDKTVKEVIKENKSYLTWLLEQKDFKWYGDVGVRLKKEIEMELGVRTKSVILSGSTNTKEILNSYTDHYKDLSMLKDIF